MNELWEFCIILMIFSSPCLSECSLAALTLQPVIPSESVIRAWPKAYILSEAPEPHVFSREPKHRFLCHLTGLFPHIKDKEMAALLQKVEEKLVQGLALNQNYHFLVPNYIPAWPKKISLFCFFQCFLLSCLKKYVLLTNIL